MFMFWRNWFSKRALLLILMEKPLIKNISLDVSVFAAQYLIY